MRKCNVEEIYMKRNVTAFSVAELHVDCMVEKRNVGTKLRSLFLWDLTQCRLLVTWRHFRTTCWSHLREANNPRRIFLDCL